MTTEIITGQVSDDLWQIATMMKENWIRHIPVVEAGTVVGLISQRDIIMTQAENTEVENRYLKMYTEGMHRRDMSGD